MRGDLRDILNIPKEATVRTSHGGSDSFKPPFLHEMILKALSRHKDLYFVFMNFAPFVQHKRLIFFPGNSDINYKMQFINTADGLIHARGIGESFGLAFSEFLIKNKQVITYAMPPQQNHIKILGDKALLYKGKVDLESLLLRFNRGVQNEKTGMLTVKNFHLKPSRLSLKMFLSGNHPLIPNLSELWTRLQLRDIAVFAR